MTDTGPQDVPLRSAGAVRDPGPPPPVVPRAVVSAALVVAVVVLVGHVVCLAGVGGAGGGVPWAPGTTAADHPGAAARWATRPLDLVLGLCVLVGPVVVLCCTGAAAVSLHASGRAGSRPDAGAVGVVATALVMTALLLARGAELWVWFLD